MKKNKNKLVEKAIELIKGCDNDTYARVIDQFLGGSVLERIEEELNNSSEELIKDFIMSNFSIEEKE